MSSTPQPTIFATRLENPGLQEGSVVFSATPCVQVARKPRPWSLSGSSRHRLNGPRAHTNPVNVARAPRPVLHFSAEDLRHNPTGMAGQISLPTTPTTFRRSAPMTFRPATIHTQSIGFPFKALTR